jgi:DNA-directed RNA polymerase beta subunit
MLLQWRNIILGTMISTGMVVIGKVQVVSYFDAENNTGVKFKDMSTIWTNQNSYRVHNVTLTSNDFGEQMVHVSLISVRVPQLGKQNHASAPQILLTFSSLWNVMQLRNV